MNGPRDCSPGPCCSSASCDFTHKRFEAAIAQVVVPVGRPGEASAGNEHDDARGAFAVCWHMISFLLTHYVLNLSNGQLQLLVVGDLKPITALCDRKAHWY